MARCFSIDRTTSYRWETAKPDWTLATLQEALLQAFEQSEETYGSRRLSLAVTCLDLKIGQFKKRCLMREMQLKVKCPKAKIWRKQAVVFVENNANQQCPLQPNTIWAGDITYIATDEGWLYLAVVITLRIFTIQDGYILHSATARQCNLRLTIGMVVDF